MNDPESTNFYVNLWLKDYNLLTQETYGRIVFGFFQTMKINNINQISQHSLDVYAMNIQNRPVNSQHLIIETLRSFLAFLYKEKISRINLAEMLQSVKADKSTKSHLEFEEFFELVDLIKEKSSEDYQIVMMMYLEGLKASEVAAKISKSRQKINAILRKYHPVATPEMVKNSLPKHSKKLAEFYLSLNTKEK